MDEKQLRALVTSILAELPSGGEGSGADNFAPKTAPIPLEASARHVHLTTEAIESLFGKGAALTMKRSLSQPGEFLSEERVKLVTPKGELPGVAVLGPARKAVQAELSLTDCRALGLNAPINLSGDLTGAADVLIVGPAGHIDAKGCVIAARNHIHMTPADAARYGVSNGAYVQAATDTARPVTFGNVAVRVSADFALAMHIDFDEANACAWTQGASVTIRPCGKRDGTASPETTAAVAAVPAAGQPDLPKLITESLAKTLAQSSQTLLIPKGTLITPAAKDVFFSAGVTLKVQ
jgi:propanediol utilization protein